MHRFILLPVCIILALSQCTPRLTTPRSQNPSHYTSGSKPPTEPGKCYAKVLLPTNEGNALKTEKQGWMEVICENQFTPRILNKMKRALQAQGYETNHSDWKSALVAYQKDNNLAQGALTLESLFALNVLP